MKSILGGDAVIGEKRFEEGELLLGPPLLLGVVDQAIHVFLHAVQSGAMQALQVGNDVLHRLVGGLGVEDVVGRAVDEDHGVQQREQKRIDPQFVGDQRKQSGHVDD